MPKDDDKPDSKKAPKGKPDSAPPASPPSSNDPVEDVAKREREAAAAKGKNGGKAPDPSGVGALPKPGRHLLHFGRMFHRP